MSRSLDIDPSARVFVDAPSDRRTILVTTERSDASRRAALAEVADIVIAGDDGVDVVARARRPP